MTMIDMVEVLGSEMKASQSEIAYHRIGHLLNAESAA